MCVLAIDSLLFLLFHSFLFNFSPLEIISILCNYIQPSTTHQWETTSGGINLIEKNYHTLSLATTSAIDSSFFFKIWNHEMWSAWMEDLFVKHNYNDIIMIHFWFISLSLTTYLSTSIDNPINWYIFMWENLPSRFIRISFFYN